MVFVVLNAISAGYNYFRFTKGHYRLPFQANIYKTTWLYHVLLQIYNLDEKLERQTTHDIVLNFNVIKQGPHIKIPYTSPI